MPGATKPLNPNDEARVFSEGSSLTAQNGFTGYWHGGDLGAFTEPFLGADSDFIEVSVLAGMTHSFSVLSDLLLIGGWPYGASGPTTYVVPEVQFIGLTVWQQVELSDGSIGYVDVAEGEEATDDIFSDYANGNLGQTKYEVTFQAEGSHYQDFVGSGSVYRIENGEVVIVSFPLIYDGYTTTGRYFVEVVSVEANPIYTEAMAGAPIDTNGRYVLMSGLQTGETLANGFRTYAWGSNWLQTIQFGSTTPVPTDPEDDNITHIVDGPEVTVLTATGAPGNPKGGDASIVVKTRDGAASVGGTIHILATAKGGQGVVEGGAGSVLFGPFYYSGKDLSLTGRAEGGDGPTPGSASASISGTLLSMGLASDTSLLELKLSALGGLGNGGARGTSTIIFVDNTINGWGGRDIVNIRLGASGEATAKNFSDNSFSLSGGNDRLNIIIDGTGTLHFALNQFQGGDGFDILTLDVEQGIDFSLSAALEPTFTAFVTGFEVLRGGRGNDTLTADTTGRYLQGEGGNDELNGASGNDIIDGGPGNDTLDGGFGLYDTVTFEQLELGADGVTVSSRATQGVTANLETGVATGAGSDTLAGFENIRGTKFNDVLTGDTGDNVLKGLEGNDTLNGGWGADILMGGAGNDILIGDLGEDVADYSPGNQSHLFEPAANPAGGVHVDLAIEGPQDTISAGLDDLIGIEHLVGTDFSDVLKGDAWDNVLTGGGGNDTLDGRLGRNQLYGGSGNDTLIIEVVNGFTGFDIDGGADIDSLLIHGPNFASTSFSIPGLLGSGSTLAGVESLSIILQSNAGLTVTGSSLADSIVTSIGNDIIDGGAGADMLYGGLGNDTYHVDSQADLLFEGIGEGTDSVFSSASHYLFANLENLTLAMGAGDLFGVGNALDNEITGNGGNNLLLGGDGADTLNGGDGDDVLFGEAGFDTLNGGAGIDYLVGGAYNDIIDGGADPDAIYGQDGDDALSGGSGFFTDIIVGGDGNDGMFGNSGLGDYDLMDGGAGNDSYFVDTGDDLTFEAAGGGTDTVYASVAGANNGVYLYANVENLILMNATAFGVGNELDNSLTGSAIGNWLLGGAGNDTINGKEGDDVLFGEAGSDTFVFEAGSGADVIGDFNAAEDVIDLDAYNFASFAVLQANFVQVGADGAIDLGGGNIIVLHGVTMASLNAGDFVL